MEVLLRFIIVLMDNDKVKYCLLCFSEVEQRSVDFDDYISHCALAVQGMMTPKI